MSVSPYSIGMALLWFTVASFLGSFVLRRADKYGLFLVTAIFLLALLRGVMPLDLHGSIIIRSKILYPTVQDLLATEVYRGFTLGSCLLALWGTGTVLQLWKLLWSFVRRARFLRAVPCDGAEGRLAVLFGEVCREYGYHGKFALAVSPKVATARQAGFVYPYILLSADISAFSDQDIRNIFRHELCHYLGGDLWIKLGMQVARCLLWWNPVMSRLSDSIGQLLELICDRRACKNLSKMEQLGYLDTLLNFAKGAPKEASNMALCYLEDTEEAKIRLRFQLMVPGTPSKCSRLKLWGSCILCVMLFVASYCVILQPGLFPAPMDEGLTITPMNLKDAYILQANDGTFMLYYEDSPYIEISEEQLFSEPFSSLPVIHERKSET